jgi:hypothetical protein
MFSLQVIKPAITEKYSLTKAKAAAFALVNYHTFNGKTEKSC